MKEVVFTPEQKKQFEGCYLISDNKMVPLGNLIELTEENFKAFWIDEHVTLQELTTEDFEYDRDNNFEFSDGDDFVSRKDTPSEVEEFFDKVITKRMAEED